jgi:hypothetical protein
MADSNGKIARQGCREIDMLCSIDVAEEIL